MNPIIFAVRRPITTFMLVVTLGSGGFLGFSNMSVASSPSLNTPKIYAFLDYVGASVGQMKEYVVGKVGSYFHKHEEESHQEQP